MTAVILLPGIGAPAHLDYVALTAELAHSSQVVASPVVTKELEGRHHLDAPHRAEPCRVAAALTAPWEQAG